MTELILASTSKYRRQLLEQLHWPFTIMAPDVDESVYKNQNMSPKDLAEKLSFLKAHDVLSKNPDSVVIGSDQVCSLGDTIFSKPQNNTTALQQLKLMSGQTHQLITSVTICSSQMSYTWTNTTSLTMRSLSEEAIQKYLEIDSPYDCAGSYKLESMGIKLFSKIEMTDHTAIIGLPLIEISNVLISRFGFKF